jgi:hypothetical protein
MSSDIQPNILFDAAKKHMSFLVEALLKEEGFDPNEKDELGNTPLFYAADVGNIIAIGYSLSPEALDTIKILIDNGANPDLPNNSGETVLEIARNLVTAGGEYNTWLTLASILYGNNTPIFKERIAKVEKEFDPGKLFKTKNTTKEKEVEFPTFPSEKTTSNATKPAPRKKEKIGKKSLITAFIIALAFLLSPISVLFFTWSDLFALSSDWLWIDNVIVGITLLLSGGTIGVLNSEKKYPQLILVFLLPFLACIAYFALVISFFHPDARYKIKKHYYLQSAFQYGAINYWVQEGFYEDFLKEESGNKLRADEELITRLALGLKPNEERSEIGKGFGGDEYAKQGFVTYVSFREMNLSDKEIFMRPEAIGLFYALALAEANPDLLEISKIPTEFSRKYIHFKEGEKFPLGILDDSKMNLFYDLIVSKITDASEIETELAVFILTQIPVDLEDSSFEIILNHWMEYKKFYEKELRYLIALRKEIRQKFLKAANPNKAVKVDLVNSTERSNWDLVKPFLISSGFAVELGDDIRLPFLSTSEFLKDKKVYKTKPVKKTRTVTRTVSNYGTPMKYRDETTTETYTDYVSDGFDIVPTYVYTYSFPNIVPAKTEVKLCGMLADCYLNSEKETTLPLEAYARGETWIYALPKKLVCKKYCDGR